MINTRYYYSKLNQLDKKVYKAIYEGIMHYKSYVEVSGVSLNNSKVGWIYHCVLWDNPFIFTVGEYAMWHALSADKTRIKMTTLCDATSEKKHRKELENAVNRILSIPGLRQMTDFQKEVFVHDFIINNVTYDSSLGKQGTRIEPYTVYGALVERKAVCEGIAKAVKLLLNLLDVKCIVASGSFDGHPHAWNIVKIDKFSYNLDVTMDLGRVIHKGMMRYNYFNFRDGDISNYKVDNPDLMPKCSAIRYQYVIQAAGFVSSYERLKMYILNSLKRRKSCLYFKPNRNVQGEYTNITFSQFKREVNRAYSDVANQLQLNTRGFIDDTGPCEIISMEIIYN